MRVDLSLNDYQTLHYKHFAINKNDSTGLANWPYYCQSENGDNSVQDKKRRSLARGHLLANRGVFLDSII